MRNVLITGGSRGIGAETARLFAQKGDRVFINYQKDHDGAATVQKETGAEIFRADIGNAAEVEAMFAQLPGIDVLVNNAGIAQFQFFDALTDEEWRRMMDVTLSGAFYCIRAALPHMIHQKAGCIVNVSSIWGICGAACEVAYSTAKAGLIGMTKALAKEVGPSGIRVNCVAPGVIDTAMNHTLSDEAVTQLCEDTPLGRMGSPKEVAQTILFLSENNFFTGQVLSPNGGLVI